MAELRRWAIGLGILGAVVVAGCDSGETTSDGTAGTGGTAGSGGTSGTAGTAGSGGTGGGLVCPEDPAEGPVSEGCGLWVSAGQGDDANEGTQAKPLKTLTHAIELAEKGAGRVYACSETFVESLVVPDSVSVYGGFDCDAGWAYVGEAKRSILASPGPVAVMWIHVDGATAAFMGDFTIESADATEPGGSSIAGFVRDDMTLTVYRTEFIAGNGADGADGAPGDANDLPAAAGAPGNDGADACSAAESPGGAAVENACSAGTSKGGAGGDSGPMLAESGEAGEPAGDIPGGAGGLGQQAGPVCTAGGTGASGEQGSWGLGGGRARPGEYGWLLPTGYVGFDGEAGAPGMPGQGGGGGGTTFGSVAVCGAAKPGGAAGGSGGAGGCGGKGGSGGQAGGSSFAFATRSINHVTLYGGFVSSGDGGNGGNGGPAQKGGAGGAGGKGGQGFGAIPPGCAGGKGGAGGNGGIGGGGRGGHSSTIVAIAGPMTYPSLPLGIKRAQGVGGQGGMGSPESGYSNGYSGVTGAEIYLDP